MPRTRGAKAQGRRYEKVVGKYLLRTFGPDVCRLGPWIEFNDAGGPGWAQLDALLHDPAGQWAIVVECKLTWCEAAWGQMERKYAPLIRHILPDARVATLQVCCNLALGQPIDVALRRTPEQLCASPEPGRFTWHWRGR